MNKTSAVTVFIAVVTSSLAAQQSTWTDVENVFGKKGSVQGDIFKISYPRNDLSIKVGEVSVEPALALTSWIAFKHMGDDAMTMGDLVLLEREVEPVLSKLLEQGVEVSALHNHIINEMPHVMYMHFGGQGNAVKLAQALKSALALTGTRFEVQAPPSPLSTFDWSRVEKILGRSGKANGSVYQFGVPRAEAIMEGGETIPPFMGMATAMNLQPVGENVATTGDFVLVSSEVHAVMKALTDHGIAVTALHNHMLNETPRLFFIHFWGLGKAETIAEGLKAALDSVNTVKK